ncbi:hypothetical protein RHMOL_Rhmol06G0085900 [Rhododendron molle]|uniref:Uncharacterized protein n=1 Tax=Rhododendron molle TaxID=49168 RepID=A0ACC0NCH9_RHOML|nr:hypothetical protein RHMOL_Rhmol06G0085900 [Rhododendron molle]
MQLDDTYVLCKNARETHHHLFFRCSFSSIVWHHILRTTSILGIPDTLADIVEWFVWNGKNKDFRSLILSRMLAATVYGIWRERNVRVFQNLTTQIDAVSLNIVNSIRDFLCSIRRVKKLSLKRSLGAS